MRCQLCRLADSVMKMIHYFSDKAKRKYIKADTILQNTNVKQY